MASSPPRAGSSRYLTPRSTGQIIGICIFFFFIIPLKHPLHPSSVTPASNCRIDRLSDRILLKPLFVLFFSRVTIKMDVSYTDHSHIIGKGGNTIRR